MCLRRHSNLFDLVAISENEQDSEDDDDGSDEESGESDVDGEDG